MTKEEEAIKYLIRPIECSTDRGLEKSKEFTAYQMAIYALKQQKTGRWIEQEGYDGDTYYDCSECGESFCLIDGTPTDNLYNYCPNCGAKMEVEEDG